MLRPHVGQLPALAPRAASRRRPRRRGADLAPVRVPAGAAAAAEARADGRERPRRAARPGGGGGVEGRLEKIQYQRPEDQQFGEVAAATVGGWLPNLKFDAEKAASGCCTSCSSRARGEGAREDDTHELGALLARMSSTGGANELLPLLRALEMEPGLCSALLPSLAKKKGVIGLFKKGMNAKGMSEQLLGALQKELPKLPRPPPRRPQPVRAANSARAAADAPAPHRLPRVDRARPRRRLRQTADAGAVRGRRLDRALARRRLSREGQVAASSKGRAQLEGHPAARSVVAVKMLKRRGTTRSGSLKGRRRRRAADAQGRREGRRGVSAGGGARRGSRRRRGALEPELRALLDAANGGGAEVSEGFCRARALALAAGSEAAVGLPDLAALLMAADGADELSALNPLLSAAEAAAVLSAATALQLRASRAAHLARLLALARRLASNLKGGADAPVLADALAAQLAAKRVHVEVAAGGGAPTVDPRLLAFEVSTGFVLRPQQVALVRSLVKSAKEGASSCHQMLMGEEKTTVVCPMLALVLGDGKLVMQVVPAALLAFALSVLRARLAAAGCAKRCGPSSSSGGRR